MPASSSLRAKGRRRRAITAMAAPAIAPAAALRPAIATAWRFTPSCVADGPAAGVSGVAGVCAPDGSTTDAAPFAAAAAVATSPTMITPDIPRWSAQAYGYTPARSNRYETVLPG